MTAPCSDPITERRYVGHALIGPAMLDKHPVPVGAFADGETRRIVEAVMAIHAREERVTDTTLRAELEARGYHREAQLDPWRFANPSDDPGALARRIKELAELRVLRAKAVELVQHCESDNAASGRAREMLRELVELRPEGDSASRVQTLREVYTRTAEEMFAAEDDSRMRLGWGPLDRVYGPTPGQVLVLGAQTNVGKSSAIAAWTTFLATRGSPVGVISVEDATEDWGAKWLGEAANENPAHLWGMRDKTRLANIVDAGLRTADLPIFFSEVADRSLDGVLSDMAYMRHKHGVRVVMVDYLQAITLPAHARDPRTGTDHNLAQLIAQAGRLGVALVLACQLARPPKDRAFREPTKHDLKESGTIENRAQCIVMLWRDPDGHTWGKVDKVKRMPLPDAPFRLVRHPATGALMAMDEPPLGYGSPAPSDFDDEDWSDR